MKNYLLLVLVLFIGFSCKKNTSNSSNNSTSNPVVTTFSIDGKTVSNLSHSSFASDSTHYGVIAYGANANPEIQIIFSGTVTPAAGTYQITNGSVTFAKCSVTLSDTGYSYIASSGYLNVTTSATAPDNTVSFNNIAVNGSAGHHTVSGTITY
jgi:hypothetical protein